MGLELTTLLVIGTDGIGSCKSNYYTITTTTAPFFGVCFSFFFYILEKNVVMQVCNTFFFTSVMNSACPNNGNKNCRVSGFLLVLWINNIDCVQKF